MAHIAIWIFKLKTQASKAMRCANKEMASRGWSAQISAAFVAFCALHTDDQTRRNTIAMVD